MRNTFKFLRHGTTTILLSCYLILPTLSSSSSSSSTMFHSYIPNDIPSFIRPSPPLSSYRRISRLCSFDSRKGDDTASTQEKDLFSVAPMMGHTDRHYFTFHRLMGCRRTHLYTEMIPATSIVAAYRRALSSISKSSSKSSTSSKIIHWTPEEVCEVLDQTFFHTPAKAEYLFPTLQSLLQFDPLMHPPISVQLGGSDPETLKLASAICAAVGYGSINWNCGCPSIAVTRSNTNNNNNNNNNNWEGSGGVRLMSTPNLATQCVNAMKDGVELMRPILTLRSNFFLPEITVKHRLGVRMASTFDATSDRLQPDDDSVKECANFVRAITSSGAVSKVIVHARLGLLGDFSSTNHNDPHHPSPTTKTKVDHKREAYRTKRRARQSTIRNRDVPPLRPGVVDQLAESFQDISFITNGGIQTLEDASNRLHGVVKGVMIGRAVINHPCSFANADHFLWGSSKNSHIHPPPPTTRGEVLLRYMDYCKIEEEKFLEDKQGALSSSSPTSTESLEGFRRRLVAAPFFLFVGESKNDSYQRTIRKLALTNSSSSSSSSPTKKRSVESILNGAIEVANLRDSNSWNKPIYDHVPYNEIPIYDAAPQRSGPLQRNVW